MEIIEAQDFTKLVEKRKPAKVEPKPATETKK